MKRALLAVLLLLAVTLAGCGDNGSADSDGDGLTDRDESQGWTILIDMVGRRISRDITSDPGLQDTDGDGVPDPIEFAIGLDPRSRDTDEDGLTDCQEVMHTNKEQCEDPDWEGRTDGGYKTIGNNADSDPRPTRYVNNHQGYVDETGTAPATIGWGDGISDGDEIGGYNVTLPSGATRFVRTDPLRVDSDGDVAEDGEERFLFDTDPTTVDTDGDGCGDGLDPLPTFDERLDLGLQSVTWAPPGESGSTELQLLLHVADNGFNHPEASGMTVGHGETVDLTDADVGTYKQAFCSFTPWHPWVRISVQARTFEDGRVASIPDLSSDDVPNDRGIVWWNVRTGQFHWDAEAAQTFSEQEAFEAADGVLSWSGRDGSVVFSPQVIKPHNQNP